MSKQEKLLDDLARLAGGAAGFMGDTKEQFKNLIRGRVDEWAQDMDLVPREDFERLQISYERMRTDIDNLIKRIEVLEQKLSGKK